MDPDWLRHLLTQGQDSLAGTAAEWENFNRFMTELESDWRDGAGLTVFLRYLETVRTQSRVLRDRASSHIGVLGVVGSQALDFTATRAAHDGAAAEFGRARADAISDLDEALSDAAQSMRLSDTSTSLCNQAVALTTQLRFQS